MKPFVYSLLSLAAGASLLAADPAPDASSELKDQKDRTSYALGVNFGSNLKNRDVDVNIETVARGIKDALAGKPLLNEQQMQEVFKQLQTEMMAKQEEKKKQNKAEGEKFLAENAAKPGIQKLESGVQYKVIKEGSGDTPKATDEVSVKYTGKLINGTVFDSTDNRGGAPTKFKVNGVIKGWTEALQKMKEGDVWELYIPSELAYGEAARPGSPIPPNSALIFNVELVEVHPAPEVKPQAAQQPVTSDIIKVPSAEELKKGAKIEIIKQEDLDKEIEKEKARKAAEEAAKTAPKPQ